MGKTGYTCNQDKTASVPHPSCPSVAESVWTLENPFFLEPPPRVVSCTGTGGVSLPIHQTTKLRFNRTMHTGFGDLDFVNHDKDMTRIPEYSGRRSRENTMMHT